MVSNNELKQISELVAETVGVSFEEMLSKQKNASLNMARGVFFLVCKLHNYHPKVVGKFLNRSRCSCILTTKQYLGYYDSKDKLVCSYVKQIEDALKK